MNKKIKMYAAMAVATAAVLPMACKKDKAEADDLEIDVITPNLSLTATSSTYIDEDTTFSIGANNVEFYMSIGLYNGNNVAYLDLDGDSKFQNDVNTTVNGEGWDFLPILAAGTTIDTSATAWLESGYYTNDDGYLFVNDKDPLPGASAGIAGQGDKYVAFRKGTGSSYKYGWMKVNVSADANTLTIKEVAMANVANKVIKVGAK